LQSQTINSYKKSKTAWIVILSFGILNLMFLLLGVAKIVNLVFPLGALLVGIFLYFNNPILYVGFVWWLLFITALVRRLVDYNSNFTEPSPILLAPYLVILVTFANFLKKNSEAHLQQTFPFILSLFSVVYGFLVGLLNFSTVSVCVYFVKWTTPILFGFHIFSNWKEYPNYCKNLEKVFLWGIIFMGTYGVFQYIYAPAWDNLWLINAENISFGNPKPFEIRVWSTMNSPGAFATMMAAGLLFLFGSKSKLRYLAMSIGYLSFLLTLARTAWGSWFFGLLFLSLAFKGKQKSYLLVTIFLILFLVVALINIEPFSTVILERFGTFLHISEDHSANVRQNIYKNLLEQAAFSFVGSGLGSPKNDSGILALLFSLGWFGTLLYSAGLIRLVISVIRSFNTKLETFAYITGAIAIANCCKIFLGVSIIEISGIILWGCLAMNLSAIKFKCYQSKLNYQSLKLQSAKT